MYCITTLNSIRRLFPVCSVCEGSRPGNLVNLVRFAKTTNVGEDGCTRAHADIPSKAVPCKERRKKKKSILHKIKLKIIEGGTNFGTPFRRVQCKEEEVVCEKPPKPEKPAPKPKKMKEKLIIPDARPGVTVTVLGSDTGVGQYVALLLKQCPCIKRLRLYEAAVTDCCCRTNLKVVQDLQNIDTNCIVQGFSCQCNDLDLCLQNTDVVLMLESAYANMNMPFEQRFQSQAPLVKCYADAISRECPKAFVIVCATPVDCMVPLVAETLKETGWYDRRKLMGSMAVPEMRASTLAARALGLEPKFTRVPCIGGSEGEALVPLFSKAVSYFDFTRSNAELLTWTVRNAPWSVLNCECNCLRSADLSEAHALASLVKSVSYALLCQDIPRISGFVETDSSQVISPARYLALDLLVNKNGICKKFDIPAELNSLETDLVDSVWCPLMYSVEMAKRWSQNAFAQNCLQKGSTVQKYWHIPKHYDHIDDCVVQLGSG